MDLTQITTPFGLLDAETQAALKAHGGPWEMYDGAPMNWQDIHAPQWQDACTYRVRPALPREWWIVEWSDGDTHLYVSENEAETAAEVLERIDRYSIRVIRVVEVLP